MKVNNNKNNKNKFQQKKPPQKYNQTSHSTRISDYMNLNEQYLNELNSKVKKNDQSWYGDKYTSKYIGSICLWFTNPCGIGINPNKLKNHNSLSFLGYKSRCDYFGLAETNVN